MPMQAADIESLIKASIPDAQVELTALVNDGDHWAATVVSSAFKGKTRVQQQMLVNAALKDVLGGDLHALALTTRAPA
jgi:stress-induced morphogen